MSIRKDIELLVAPLVFSGQYHLHFYPTAGALLRRLRPDVLHVDEEPYNLATWQLLRIGQALGARGLFFTWQNLSRRYPWPFRHFEQANYRRAAARDRRHAGCRQRCCVTRAIVAPSA